LETHRRRHVAVITLFYLAGPPKGCYSFFIFNSARSRVSLPRALPHSPKASERGGGSPKEGGRGAGILPFYLYLFKEAAS